MSNRGQPSTTYRARRQRGKRPSESFAQQPEPVVRAEHEDLVVDSAAIDRHRALYWLAHSSGTPTPAETGPCSSIRSTPVRAVSTWTIDAHPVGDRENNAPPG